MLSTNFDDFFGRLVSALVLSRLGHCNAVLAGLPASTLAVLQSPARSRETCTRPEAARPRNSRSPRVALVTRGAANRVQTALRGPRGCKCKCNWKCFRMGD